VLRRVVTELEIVDQRRIQHARQIEQSVLRNSLVESAASADIAGRLRFAVFARIAHICSMAAVDVVIETDVAEVFVHIRRKRAGHNILKRVRRTNLAGWEGRQERADGRHSLGTRDITESALAESDINALGEIFLAGEKEQFVLDNTSADRSAELVEP